MCLEDSGLGYPLLQGKEGTGNGETTPPVGWRPLLPLAGGVGRRVPVTTSPRLELELSPDLLCGQRGRRAVSKEAGVRAGDLCSHRLSRPPPRPSFTSPTGEASGHSVSSEYQVNPWGLLLAGWPLPGVGVPRPQPDTWS